MEVVHQIPAGMHEPAEADEDDRSNGWAHEIGDVKRWWVVQAGPVARKTLVTGIAPKRSRAGTAPRVVAVVAFDGVVLGDLSTPCEIFGRARGADGRALYEVRICSVAPKVQSEHVTPAGVSPILQGELTRDRSRRAACRICASVPSSFAARERPTALLAPTCCSYYCFRW
jgi:hypothetical protein